MAKVKKTARAKKPLEDEDSYIAQTAPLNDKRNWIPTGSIALDMGIGMGIPRVGQIIEIYGKSQSRKSSLALLIVANAQQMGIRAGWYSGEDGLIETVADLAEVDLRQLRYKQIATVEDLFRRAGNFVRKAEEDGTTGLWVIDSLSSLSANAEIYNPGKVFMRPPAAKAITAGWRTGSHTLRKSKGTAVIISHEKDDNSVPGGKATGFYSSVRLCTSLAPLSEEEVKLGYAPGEIRNEDGEPVGVQLIVDVAKTRYGPIRRIPVKFYYDRGFPIDPIDDMVVFLQTQGIMFQKGAWWSIDPHHEKSFYMKDFVELYHAKGKAFWDDLIKSFITKKYASICEKRGITQEQHEQMYADFCDKQEKEQDQELEQIMNDEEQQVAAGQEEDADAPTPPSGGDKWSLT